MRTAYDSIRSSSSYAGIALPAYCGPIEVYAKHGDPTIAESVSSSATTLTNYRFHSVPNSFGSLLDVQSTIAQEISQTRSRGINVYRFWPDMTVGLERLEVINADPGQLAWLESRYGTNLVYAVSVTSPQRLTLTADDAHDTPAFSAGDFIENTSAGVQSIGLGYCTSAFGIHTGSGLTAQHFMLTAGHCSRNQQGQPVTNTSWVNAYDGDINGTPAGGLAPIGVVSKNLISSNNLDAAYITSSTSTQVWQGSPIMSFKNQQFSAASALVGNTVCFNGGYEGEVCGAVVQSTGYMGCDVVSGLTLCNEIDAKRSSGVLLGEGGSGGPIYGLGPEQFAMGVQSLGVGNPQSCDHFTYRGVVCFSEGTFVDVPSVLGAGGGVVNVFNNP